MTNRGIPLHVVLLFSVLERAFAIWEIRELKQPRKRQQKNLTNLHIRQSKTVFLHALHMHFPSCDILKTFSFFLRREMTCFAVVWTT